MKTKLVRSENFSIYDYDKRIARTYELIKKDLSNVNLKLIQDYDMTMISEQMSKAARHKHLQTLLNLSRYSLTNLDVYESTTRTLGDGTAICTGLDLTATPTCSATLLEGLGDSRSTSRQSATPDSNV